MRITRTTHHPPPARSRPPLRGAQGGETPQHMYTFRTIREIKYILENYQEMTNQQIAERLGLRADQVRGVLRARGIRKAPGRGFRKGQAPHNKGRRMRPETYQKVARTMFKPGNLPPATKTPGTIRHTKDGPYVKADHRRRWVSIRRWIWEQTHGPLPPGHVVILSPGADPNQPRPDQLLAITRAELIKKNAPHLRGK